MYLNGIMLVSSILDFQTARFDARQRPAVRRCSCRRTRRPPGTTSGCRPTCRRSRCGDVLREVEAFAAGEYATALLQGDAPDARPSARTRGRSARALHRPLDRVRRAQPTCASRSSASARSCCATSAAPSAASTAASPASTRDARRRATRVRPERWPRSGRPTPRPSTTTCGASCGYETDPPYEILSGRDRRALELRHARTASPTSREALRDAIAKQPGPAACSSRAATTTSRRRTSRPSTRSTTSAWTPSQRGNVSTGLLRGRPHDVHPRGRARAPEGRRRQVRRGGAGQALGRGRRLRGAGIP